MVSRYNAPVLADAWRACVLAPILLLLPGLVLVRAPWPAVPAFSIGFWLLTWPLLPGRGTGRAMFVQAALGGFALLALLRVAQPRLWQRPRNADLLAGAGALLALLPFVVVPVPRAPDLSFDAAAARVVAWHDGVPATFEPLIPGASFANDAPGFSSFAADFIALARLAPHRAVFAVHLAGRALFLLSLFFALQRVAGTPPAPAARGALAAVAAAAWVLRALVAAGGATELQAAFLLLAAALLVKRTRRAASVAGWFFAVSALAVAPSVRALAGSAAVAVAAAVLATGVARRNREVAAASDSGRERRAHPDAGGDRAVHRACVRTALPGHCGVRAPQPRPIRHRLRRGRSSRRGRSLAARDCRPCGAAAASACPWRQRGRVVGKPARVRCAVRRAGGRRVAGGAGALNERLAVSPGSAFRTRGARRRGGRRAAAVRRTPPAGRGLVSWPSKSRAHSLWL